jgi:O-antigen/teichoic acid export membrane protein
MISRRPYLRNMVANWFGFFVNIAANLFLTPFVIRHLGMEAYGVWVLLISLTGYLSLIEFGIRPGVGRYVNYYLSLQQIDKVNGLLSTAFGFSVLTVFPLLLASSILVANLPAIFPKIPAPLIPSAQIGLMLIALNVWLSFFAASCGSITVAFERFDLDNLFGIIVLAVRIVAIVLVLHYGGGLIELAWVDAGTAILRIVLLAGLSKYLFSQLRIHPSLISRDRFQDLMSYGAWAFVSGIALQLTYWSDSLIITWFLGPAYVAIYAIGAMLISYGSTLVDRCSVVFSPQIMKDCAKKDFFAVKDLFKKATITMLGVGTIIFLGFIAFGREFIELWMGENFRQGYEIVILLAISKMFGLPVLAGGAVFWGLNKIRYSACLNLVQGVTSIVLGVIFIALFEIGIVGVALGNLAPQLVASVFIWILVCRWINLPVGWLPKQVLLRWVTLIVVFYLICVCIITFLPSGGWVWFAVKVLLAVGVYVPLMWVILLSKENKIQLWTYLVGARSQKSPKIVAEQT